MHSSDTLVGENRLHVDGQAWRGKTGYVKPLLRLVDDADAPSQERLLLS